MSVTRNAKILSLSLLSASLLTLAACGGIETEAKYPSGLDRQHTNEDIYADKQSILGKDGLSILGGKSDDPGDGSNGIGVNSFLWRASLDTVSFMPLSSVDPFGGVILTDWYTAPDNPNERMKLNVFIMTRELKANGIRVRAFRQAKKGSSWHDAAVSEKTTRDLEDAILVRARQLRVKKLNNEK